MERTFEDFCPLHSEGQTRDACSLALSTLEAGDVLQELRLQLADSHLVFAILLLAHLV